MCRIYCEPRFRRVVAACLDHNAVDRIMTEVVPAWVEA